MIGAIAGEIIGSPFSSANVPDYNDLFFNIFETRTVIDPLTYKDRSYPCAPGSVKDNAVTLNNLNDFHASKPSDVPAILCEALFFGQLRSRVAFDPMEGYSKEKFDEDLGRLLEKYPFRWRPAAAYVAQTAFFLGKMDKGEDRITALSTYYLSSKDSDTQYQQVFGLDKDKRDYTLGENFKTLSQLLRGDADGFTMTKEDGVISFTSKQDPEKKWEKVLSAAFMSVCASSSWEESVRRSVALGGESRGVAALTGALAEMVFPVPERIVSSTKDFLDKEEERMVWKFDHFKEDAQNEALRASIQKSEYEYWKEPLVPIRTLSKAGTEYAVIYSIPYTEDRDMIADSIKAANSSAIIVSTSQFNAYREIALQRVDKDGKSLLGTTFIDLKNPIEEHMVWFERRTSKLYSPLTLPSNVDQTIPLQYRLDNRQKLETLKDYVRSAALEQYKSAIGPVEAKALKGRPLRFATAYYPLIEKDKIILMKGGTPYGEFGVDSKGRLRVNSNVVGADYGSEYLDGALNNRRIFYASDSDKEVLTHLRAACLDDGFSQNEEGSLKSNADLMEADLNVIPKDSKDLELPQAVEDEGLSLLLFKADSLSTADERREVSKRTIGQGSVFTAGYGNLPIVAFMKNLQDYGITKVVDIRSYNKSKTNPTYSEDSFKATLKKAGISYDYKGSVAGGHVSRELPQSFENGNIIFSTSKKVEFENAYTTRTRDNVNNSDITLSFGLNFDIAEEKLTKALAKGNYISVGISGNIDPVEVGKDIAESLTSEEKAKPLVVNISGNSIDIFSKSGFNQDRVDKIITETLRSARENGMNIASLRSGGQTGADQAAVIAAMELGLKVEVHAPHTWAYKDADGIDHYDEHGFKSRMVTVPEKELSYTEALNTESCRTLISSLAESAAQGQRVALMCCEGDPSSCHRFAMVGYALNHPDLVYAGESAVPIKEAVPVLHITKDGKILSQETLEKRVCRDYALTYTPENVKIAMEEHGKQLQARGVAYANELLKKKLEALRTGRTHVSGYNSGYSKGYNNNYGQNSYRRGPKR